MSPTVDGLRNEIRESVGRHERIESTAFTKEALAAICDARGIPIDDGRFPSKSRMRAEILASIGHLETADPSEAERPFRKAELEAIAAALESG